MKNTSTFLKTMTHISYGKFRGNLECGSANPSLLACDFNISSYAWRKEWAVVLGTILNFQPNLHVWKVLAKAFNVFWSPKTKQFWLGIKMFTVQPISAASGNLSKHLIGIVIKYVLLFYTNISIIDPTN